jgi:hypothetical protein
MRIVLAVALFTIGVAGTAFGSVPEIDPASGASALALLAGALVVMRGRRKA